MECFASFFTSKVADEEIAFRAIGKTYCDATKDLLPNLIIHSKKGYFTNIIELFFLWNNRLKKQDLQKKQISLEKELLNIDNETIYPLGTK